jgi:hypothetical protein
MIVPQKSGFASDPAIGGLPAYPSLKMMLARQRVADLRRGADRGREPRSPRSTGEGTKRVGSSSRLANGSWLYGRRDSS